MNNFFKRGWPTSLQLSISILCLVGMFGGLLFDRLIANISTILLVVNSLNPLTISSTFHKVKRSRFYQFSILFYLTYFISGIWSEDSDIWSHQLMLKIPFVILPFAFFSIDLHQWKTRNILTWSFAGILLLIIGNSMYAVLQDPTTYIEGYKRSQMIPTTNYADHIRFSMMIVGVIMMLFEQVTNRITQKWNRILLTLTGLTLIAYLHLLATKTGIVAFYLMVLVLMMGFLWRRSKFLFLGSIVGLVLMISFSVVYVPTLNSKVAYVKYEIEEYQKGAVTNYNLSDVGRLMSYEVAYENIKKQPILGVGSGDVRKTSFELFGVKFPHVPAENRLVPHNQYIYVILAVGILMFPIFVIMTFLPWVEKQNRSLYSIANALIMIVSMQFESMLEVQIGVFVYLIFTLYWMRPQHSEQVILDK